MQELFPLIVNLAGFKVFKTGLYTKEVLREEIMFDQHKLFFHKSRLKKFMNSSWDFWTSKTGAFLIGISAILVGSYQFYINKPILKYTTNTNNVISSNNKNDFKIIVKSQEYDNIYQTNVTLINTGEQALAGTDVSKIGHDPIRVVVPKDAGILHYTIDNNQTSQAVSGSLKELDGNIIINFDFLNPGNEITVTILHKNNVSGFKIVGSAVNVNEITEAWSERQILRAISGGLGVLCLLLLLNVLRRSIFQKHNRIYKL